jgi:hypothetical protein
MRAALILALVLDLVACTFVGGQAAITGAGGCVRQNCKDPDATDYTKCEAACRAQYGK